MMSVKWVIFDVGETLFSERRLFNEWADWLGVEQSMFWAVLMDFILAGEDHRRVFSVFDPDFDLGGARAARVKKGCPDVLSIGDIYPDALPAIRDLAAKAFRVGVAGNQPAHTSDLIRSLDAPIELIGMSEEWNVKKPSAEFFQKLVSLTGVLPEEIAYVGDRLDNDVRPAKAAGMISVFVRRGPWAQAQDFADEASDADFTIDSLADLPSVLAK